MSVFACLIGRDGAPVPDIVRRRIAARRAARTFQPARWRHSRHLAIFLGSDVPGVTPRIAQRNEFIAVGAARLHDTARLLELRRRSPQADSDLALILDMLWHSGPGCIEDLSGDFAFVVYDRRTHSVTAARDAFGIQRLYTASSPDLLGFSTRASLLADGDDYDLEFFAEFILHGCDAAGASAFRGVHAVPAGTISTYTANGDVQHQYWPFRDALAPSTTYLSEAEAVDKFREHLLDAVATNLAPDGQTWAQLSGGMDSSAIVGVAEGLCRGPEAKARLGGTVTLAMRPFTGADMHFAALVAEHCGVRHEVIEGWSSWEDDEFGPPLFDQPGTTLSAYAITRRLTRLVRQAGGGQLLCGAGADLYLRHKPDYVADLLVMHQGRAAFRELVTLATVSRASFWELAGRYAVYPNLPPTLRKALAPSAFRLPKWFEESFRRRFALTDRTLAVRLYRGIAGARQRARIVDGLSHEGSLLPQQHIGEDNLDWRYPFLYRPLVDFALSVPRAWHTSDGLNKRLLRAAVHPLLPPRVVARNGKGGLVPQEASAARRRLTWLGTLLRDPILAQLGVIEPNLFRTSVANVTEEARAHQSLIDRTLQLELWLQLQDPHVMSSRRRARLGASRQPSKSRGTAKEVTVHPT